MKPKVIHYDEKRAADAYKAHCALILRETADPDLRDNPTWAELRRKAYERFERAFEGKL